MQLQDFDILFCYRDTLLSELIREVDQADYSHVAMIRIIDGVTYVVDAQIEGVKMRKYIDWMKKYDYSFTIIRKPTINNTTKERLINRIEENLGKPYDKIGLFKQFWLRIYERFFRKDASIRTNDEKLYCSEFIAIVWGVKRNDITPQQLYRVFKKREYYELN